MVIHIFGAAGSGTTTLGAALAKKLGFNHIDVDDYYWLKTNIPFTISRNKEERLKMLKDDIIKNKNVVVSGAVCVWGDELISLFDLVIKLETNTSVRINRLKEREFKRFGNRIKEGGDMYKNHLRFIDWASIYDNGGLDVRSNALHNHWLKKVSCLKLILDGNIDTSILANDVLEFIKKNKL